MLPELVPPHPSGIWNHPLGLYRTVVWRASCLPPKALALAWWSAARSLVSVCAVAFCHRNQGNKALPFTSSAQRAAGQVSPRFSLGFLTLTLEAASEAFLGPPNQDSNPVQEHLVSQHQPPGTEQHYVNSAHFHITFSTDWCSGMKTNFCVHPRCKHEQVIAISFGLNRFANDKELDKVLSHV